MTPATIVVLSMCVYFAVLCAPSLKPRRKRPKRPWFEAHTPSTCSVFGHEMGPWGCAWCSDLVPCKASYSPGYLFLESANSKRVWCTEKHDPKVIAFFPLDQNKGIAWLDMPADGIDTAAAIEYLSSHGTQEEQEAAAILD